MEESPTMASIRSYVGFLAFIFFVPVFATMNVFSISLKFLELESVMLSILVLLSFFISLVILSVAYAKWLTPAQKRIFQVGGELYLLYFAAMGLFLGLLLQEWDISPIVSPTILLLLILGYHFVINNGTINDLNIKDVSRQIEYIIVGTIGLFCLFGLLWFDTLISEGTFQLPGFEGLVMVFVVIVAEEIMYRYYIQGSAQKAMKNSTAVLMVSLLFALQHGSLEATYVRFVYAFVVSIVCGFGYSRYRNLSVPLILHAAANLFSLIFLAG